jgi:hypothetical protein
VGEPMSREKTTPKTHNPPPLISCGNKELQLLEYMRTHTFKRRTYSATFNLNPSSVYDTLKRLIKKGLVTKKGLGIYELTEYGKVGFPQEIKVGKNPQWGCRGREFSLHSVFYELHIANRSFFYWEDLQKLGSVKNVKMQNWDYYQVEGEGFKFYVYPQKVAVYLDEVREKNLDVALWRSLDKLIKLSLDLEKIGIYCDKIILEKAHFAKVESILASVLIKKLGRYELILPDKRKFWIDFSGNTLEDETDSIRLRERLDKFLIDLEKSESLLSDLDKVKEDLKYIEKATHNQMMTAFFMLQIKQIENKRELIPKEQKGIKEYFG